MFYRKIIRSVEYVGIIFLLLVVWLSVSALSSIISIDGQQANVSFSDEIVGDVVIERPQSVELPSINLTENNNTATMVFVGDIMLSRGIGRIMEKQNNWLYPFEYTREYLQKADLVFGNLEGPISGRGKNQGSIYSFNMDPYTVEGLVDSNFSVLSVANNHILDYGRDAFLDTLAVLRVSKIDVVGGGINFEEAHRPVVRDVKGSKVAFLAYTNLLPRSFGEKDSVPAISYLNEEIMDHDISFAKTIADVVVVSFHWGEEYETHHNAWQERIAKQAIDAGASIVVGHHPHVVQEVEEYHGGYIAYSLGNFIFDQNFSDDTSKGIILEIQLTDKKISGIKTIGVSFNSSFQPSIMN